MGTLRGRTRAGNLRGLVQAPTTDGWPTANGWRLIGFIVLGFVISAVLTFGAVGVVVGTAGSVVLPERVSLIVVAVLALGAAGLDLYSARRQWLSPAGLSRQTPKSLLYSQTHPRLAVLFWGFDTGTAVSTFRVSAATWIVFIGAALGVAPIWVGISYAAGFSVPLVLALIVPLADRAPAGSGTRRLTAMLHAHVQTAQGTCSVLLLAGAVALMAASSVLALPA